MRSTCALSEPPHTAFGSLTQAMSVLVQQRLLRDIEEYTEVLQVVKS